MEITNFKDFSEKTENKEGIVLLGAGGSTEDWINGVTKILKEEEISNVSNPEELFIEKFMLITSGGRNDLALVIDFDKVKHSKLAIWRIKFGNCSWISDYKCNYFSQH